MSKEKEIADEEEKKVAKINADVSAKQKSCEADLAKAEPALAAAATALNTLNKANLTELKSFGKPPPIVVSVAAAVMCLSAPHDKIPKDKSWNAGKNFMGKVDQFLDSLINFDKENIHANNLKAVEPYLQDKDFEPDFVRGKSFAASGLCSWVINIVGFYRVFCDVEPKRIALAAANAELAAAQSKLAQIKAKIKELDDNLAQLTAEYEAATSAKLKCQQEADATALTISLANRLVNGLASEKVRWGESVGKLKQDAVTLPGDVLMTCSYLSYVGCFTRQYREDLIHKWTEFLRGLKVSCVRGEWEYGCLYIRMCVCGCDCSNRFLQPEIPMSEGLDVLQLLTDGAQIATWNNENLPSDRMSIENATILSNTERWPLMIDPQLQGVKWIKTREGEDLKVIHLGSKG